MILQNNPKGADSSGKGLWSSDIPIKSKVQISLGSNNSLGPRPLAMPESYPFRLKGGSLYGFGVCLIGIGIRSSPALKGFPVIKKNDTAK